MNTEAYTYLNPLTDFGFKKLFGSEINKVLLIDFLNEILPDKKIKDLTYASNEHLGDSEIDRKAIFDLYCIGENGERFIVEMQKARQNYFKDRSVFYSSFPIQEQAKRHEWNFRLEPVYLVGILDFIFEEHKDAEDVLHVIELKNQHGEVFYEKLKYIFIELPKFRKSESDLDTHFDKWIYAFRYLSTLSERPAKLQERIFTKLFEAAEIAQFSPEERKTYEKSLKYYRDIHNVVETSKQEGMEEGIEQGRAEGRAEGRVEGRKEGIISVASTMKNEGLSEQEIVRLTGLSEQEIKEL